ncbi:ArsR/SmtB family transcription factor [Streptomyces sp. NPDC050433]|uniref:ArsR/SmtB family transcription factor n=1 Tax=Streptomyces sp. NPDC050433 TaxID=3365615 RepID=UPI0037ABEF0E
MGLRVHFTNEDLRRVTMARTPQVFQEVVLSLTLLQQRPVGTVFDSWHRWARKRLPRSARRVAVLVSAEKGSPDFLTPAGADDFEAGLEQMMGTPRVQLRAEVEQYAVTSAPVSWTRSLARGAVDTLDDLGVALREYHDTVILPVRPHLRRQFDTAIAHGMRSLADGGLDSLLNGLHPAVQWRAPVLEFVGDCQDMDVHLGGRGVHLLPTFFGRQVMVSDDPAAPYTIIYPIDHHTAWHPAASATVAGTGQALAALLGETRATVLRCIELSGGATTTDLARRTGVSPGTVSHHTAVLREAGLITTRRTGTSVLHAVTPLGVTLLQGV